MNIYLVRINSAYRFLINPVEADLEGAEVLARRLNVNNLYQAGFSFIHLAVEKIYLDCQLPKEAGAKIAEFNKLADVFEMDVPGVLTLSWKIARNYWLSGFTYYKS